MLVAHAGHECCLGGLLKGGMSMNLTPGNHVLLVGRVVWLAGGVCGVGMVVTVLVVLFSTRIVWLFVVAWCVGTGCGFRGCDGCVWCTVGF